MILYIKAHVYILALRKFNLLVNSHSSQELKSWKCNLIQILFVFLLPFPEHKCLSLRNNMFPAPGSELTYEWKLPPRSWWWANLSSVFSHRGESLLTSIPHICHFPDVATKQRKVRQNNINCTHYFAPYYRFSSQFSCGEIVPNDNMSCGEFFHICHVKNFVFSSCIFFLAKI